MEETELKEEISKHLNVPYIFLQNEDKFICSNGVVFTRKEYIKGIDLQKEYVKREKKGKLFDYNYAKETGKLRRLPKPKKEIHVNSSVAVQSLCYSLLITSFGSMYISTVHTATYLFDYVDVVSAWIMSTVITIYCSTAFEVILLFFERKKYILSTVFAMLWTAVVLFSMITTVSVFYDRYNFNAIENTEASKETDSSRLALEILQKKEIALRQSITDKKQDISHRQEMEYATRPQQLELLELQKELQINLDEQQKLVFETPDATKEEDKVDRKETLFDFLGRSFGINGDILAFIMSTLSAVFINLISPFSVTVVVSFLGGKKDEHN